MTEACKNYGGFFTWDQSAARRRYWQKKTSKKVELHEYPELGMEAIWKVEVEDFPGIYPGR